MKPGILQALLVSSLLLRGWGASSTPCSLWLLPMSLTWCTNSSDFNMEGSNCLASVLGACPADGVSIWGEWKPSDAPLGPPASWTLF